MSTDELRSHSSSLMGSGQASDVIYHLEDRPPLIEASVAGFQHVLAVSVGIITPPLIISNALGLGIQDTSHIVSMSLMISGVSTFIQV